MPYGTITATLLSICGLVTAITAVYKATGIAERLFLELLLQQYLWLNDLRVGYIIFASVIGVVILVNLTVGFATTGTDDKERRRGCDTCCCARGSATGCVVK